MRTKSVLRRFLGILLLLLILFPLQISQSAERASTHEILANPDGYDGQEILLEGKATQIQLRNTVCEFCGVQASVGTTRLLNGLVLTCITQRNES